MSRPYRPATILGLGLPPKPGGGQAPTLDHTILPPELLRAAKRYRSVQEWATTEGVAPSTLRTRFWRGGERLGSLLRLARITVAASRAVARPPRPEATPTLAQLAAAGRYSSAPAFLRACRAAGMSRDDLLGLCHEARQAPPL